MVKAAEETRSGESESEERRGPGWEQQSLTINQLAKYIAKQKLL